MAKPTRTRAYQGLVMKSPDSGKLKLLRLNNSKNRPQLHAQVLVSKNARQALQHGLKGKKENHAKPKGKKASQNSPVIDEIGVPMRTCALPKYLQVMAAELLEKQRQKQKK